MIHILYNKEKPQWIFIKTDNIPSDYKTMECLEDFLNLTDPVCYLKSYHGPTFKQYFLYSHLRTDGTKIWYCSIGLWQELREYFKRYNIEYDGIDEHPEKYVRQEFKDVTLEEFKNIVDGWGLKYKPRPYQYEAAYKILRYNMSVSSLATRAGKTLIAYMIFRYGMEYLGFKKILMIVPSIQLVTQGYNDFKDYAEFFNTETVWGGGKLCESANLTIGTFQSLIKFIEPPTKGKPNKKFNPHFYDDFDCVFVDETHRATANQIKTIISQPFMNNVKLRFGMTGTIPKKHTIDYFCLKSLLGATIQEIKPKELMDEGYIAPVEIRQKRLIYNDEEKLRKAFIKCAEYALGQFIVDVNPKTGKRMKRALPPEKQYMQIKYFKQLPMGIQLAKINPDVSEEEYIKMMRSMLTDSQGANILMVEKMMSHFMTERIDYLVREIIPQCENNMIIFCHHVEYIKFLENVIRERFPDRPVMMINGSVNSKTRDKYKNIMKEHNNCILLASYACMSTGITLSNLCYGVFFESFKSEVVNMQSIGRGLGLSDMREKFILYDIIDVFNTGSNKDLLSNRIYLQGLAKIKLYKENNYDYTIEEIKI